MKIIDADDHREDEKILNEMKEYGIDKDMLGACRAYLSKNMPDLFKFKESYAGKFKSDAEFAEDLADKLGLINIEVLWPNNCIDWDEAGLELMQDYFEVNGYYFEYM